MKNDERFFADVDLPFHVWVREGRRWVLRDARTRLQGAGAQGGPQDPRAPDAATRGSRGGA